jgi:dethiobiotin synthetase
VANVLDADMPALHENIAALEQRLDAPMLGIVTYQASPDARVAATQLNTGLLKKNGPDEA